MRAIQLFICRDSRSKQLLDDLRELTKPFKDKIDLKVHLIHINKPEDFPNFLETMEELFGGISTLTFRKYGIKSIPAIVIDDRKVLEGRYPSRQELYEILADEGITLEEKRPVQPIKPIEEFKPIEEPSVSRVERYIPPEFPSEIEFPLPVEEPEFEEPSFSLEKPEEITREEKIEKEKVLKPITEEAPPPPPIPKPETKKAKRTCTTCIFYNEAAKRCAMLGRIVEDPSNPPCSW